MDAKKGTREIVKSVKAAPYPERYGVRHAAAVGLGAFALNALLGPSDGKVREDYERERKPPFAPPGWLFAPAWVLLKAGALGADLRAANLPRGVPGRDRLLGLRAADWALFSTTGLVGFRPGSPILGLAWTAAQLGLTAAGVRSARAVDRPAALLAPQLAWLAYASVLSGYGALYNPDPLLGTPAPLDLGGGADERDG